MEEAAACTMNMLLLFIHLGSSWVLLGVVEGSRPPGLVFPRLYSHGEMVQVNDPREEFRHFFSSQQVYGEQQWTFRVSTARYGTDFIAFFATDNIRFEFLQWIM